MDERKEKSVLNWIGTAVTVLLVLAVVLCLYAVIQVLDNGYVSIGDFILFRVVTGSMEPTISTGSLLVTQQVEFSSVELNDIICFRTQEAKIFGSVVTHRVVDIFSEADGSLLMETKGDANLVADVFYVNQDNFVGKVVWYTGDDSMLATVFSFLTDKVGFLGCIVFPCLLLAAMILRSCVNNIREELNNTKKENHEEQELTVDDLLGSMTPQEYENLLTQIREELIQECKQNAQMHGGEQDVGILQEHCSEKETTE